jgi:GNAT superfamily N-acetyltransferase
MVEAVPRELVVRQIAAAQTRPLRQQVLRPGRPPESSVYAGDDDGSTFHAGAFLDGQLVGIASLYAEGRSDGPPGGWRLRGMATSPPFRQRGVGRALLEASLEHVAGHGGGELWCNARTAALDFYARAGFDVVSEPFEIAGIGPHVVMRRLVAPSP